MNIDLIKILDKSIDSQKEKSTQAIRAAVLYK